MKTAKRITKGQIAIECIYDNPQMGHKNSQYPHDAAVEKASKVLTEAEYKLYSTLMRFSPKTVRVLKTEDLANALSFTVKEFNTVVKGLMDKHYMVYRPLWDNANNIVYVGNTLRFHDDNSLVTVCPPSRAATLEELRKPYFYTGSSELPSEYVQLYLGGVEV